MKEKVIELVRKALNLDESFDDNELISSDLLILGIDSIVAIQLIIMLESEFDIEFADEDLMLQSVQSIDSIMNTLQKYIHA